MSALLTILVMILTLLFSSVTFAKSYGSKICKSDLFHCYKVKRGDTWAKLFDNEEIRDIVKRINRMNTRLYPGLKIAIPKNLDDIGLLDFSPLDTQIDPRGKKVIIVDFDKLAFGAYDADGNLVLWGPISGGRGYCPDTRKRCNSPKGNFAIYTKQGKGCYSTKYPVGRGGAPMPYCMFFHGGFALHGSYDVPGFHDSHGCIRIFVDDAEWLNQDFTSGEKNIPVIIK